MSRRIPVDSESTRVVVHTAEPWHSQVTNLEPCSILKLMTILITWSGLYFFRNGVLDAVSEARATFAVGAGARGRTGALAHSCSGVSHR